MTANLQATGWGRGGSSSFYLVFLRIGSGCLFQRCRGSQSQRSQALDSRGYYVGDSLPSVGLNLGLPFLGIPFDELMPVATYIWSSLASFKLRRNFGFMKSRADQS